MSLKETTIQLRHLLDQLVRDLSKAERGNKSAAQRLRTGTVRLDKVARVYRKQSLSHEKKTRSRV